jgi:hypothetical protein
MNILCHSLPFPTKIGSCVHILLNLNISFFLPNKMPRSSSKSSSKSFKSSASKYSYTSPKSPVPAPTPVHLPQTVRVEGPGLFSSVVQGFGLGAGQSMAFNLFRSDPAPQTVKHVHELPKEYVQCLKENDDPKQCEKWLGQKETLHHLSP